MKCWYHWPVYLENNIGIFRKEWVSFIWRRKHIFMNKNLIYKEVIIWIISVSTILVFSTTNILVKITDQIGKGRPVFSSASAPCQSKWHAEWIFLILCFAKAISHKRNPSPKRKTLPLSVLGRDLVLETSARVCSIQLRPLALWPMDYKKLFLGKRKITAFWSEVSYQLQSTARNIWKVQIFSWESVV